jgi:hypothetical protein
MTHAKVLASIQGKYFLQYLPPIKSGSNTKNLIRSLMFPHTRRVSTMPLISNETIQKKHQKLIHDCLTFFELITIPLTMTHAKVLVVVKGKDFLQYPHSIKSGSNIRNPYKLSLSL